MAAPANDRCPACLGFGQLAGALGVRPGQGPSVPSTCPACGGTGKTPPSEQQATPGDRSSCKETSSNRASTRPRSIRKIR